MESDRKQEEMRLANVARKSSDDHTTANNRLDEEKLYSIANDFLHQFPMAKRYVITYGIKDFFRSDYPFTLLVRKPDDCALHAGLLNLPGGKIECELASNGDPVVVGYEAPDVAAIREFGEETGFTASFPHLCGLIIPYYNQSTFDPDYNQPPFLVYCFKAIYTLAPYQGERDNPLPHIEHVHVAKSFQWKEKTVRNIPLLLSLFHADVYGWILKDHIAHHQDDGQFGVQVDLVNHAAPYTYWQSKETATPIPASIPSPEDHVP